MELQMEAVAGMRALEVWVVVEAVMEARTHLAVPERAEDVRSRYEPD